MSEMRNPITREENFSNPAGNVMMELQEADLNKFVAGAGETRNSGGVLCTSTAECYFGTLSLINDVLSSYPSIDMLSASIYGKTTS